MRAFLVLCILSVLLAFGCKKSKTTEPDKTIPEGMRASIDGVSWVADSAAALIVTGTDSTTNQKYTYYIYLGIKVRLQEVTAVQLQVPQFQKGTFTTNNNNLIVVYQIETANGLTNYVAAQGQGTGTLTVSKYDGVNAQGTFSFLASDYAGSGKSVNVKSGTLNMEVGELNLDEIEVRYMEPEKWIRLPELSHKYFTPAVKLQ